MNRNAYTPITADPVLLRLNSCRDWGTLHQRIRKAFGFPITGKTGMPCGIA